MGAVGWLTRDAADVPPADTWLTVAERSRLERLTVPHRRADWRLGRYTAKAAVAAWLHIDPSRVQILASAGGSPQASVDGDPAAVSVSISHRGGRALAAVGHGGVVGCDLELVEPRSDAFLEDWLTPDERTAVEGAAAPARATLANLLWSAKEAAAKVRQAGLRLDVRGAAVRIDEAGCDWRPLAVRWSDGSPTIRGWWRVEGVWIYTIAGRPAPALPVNVDRGVRGGSSTSGQLRSG